MASLAPAPTGKTDPQPPRARERQRLERRAEILDAAIDLFSARGFDGTSLPAIAAACGVPVPLIVYHFSSKEQLWRDAVDAIYARYEAHFAAATDAAPGHGSEFGRAFYRAQIAAYIHAIAAHPQYMRMLFQEGTHPTPRLAWLVERHQRPFTARLTALIERAQGEGLLPPVDPVHLKFLLSGAFVMPIVLAAEYRLLDGTDARSPEFVAAHIALCERLLLPGLAD